MLGSSGRRLKEFGSIHELACPAENEIYAAEVLNWRVQKLILHPAKYECGCLPRWLVFCGRHASGSLPSEAVIL